MTELKREHSNRAVPGSGDESGDRTETNADRLRRSLEAGAMTVTMVSALAGDRALTESERDEIDRHANARGPLFFSDLLYSLTHLYFAPEVATPLWDRLLVHKRSMSKALGRDVHMLVATLDYLSSRRAAHPSLILIPEAYFAEIASLSMRDRMTGLYNHTTFYELLALEFVSHRRHASSIALMLLDIDDFKTVNDRFGHVFGDRVLVDLARMLTETAREADVCCRFGGEEFAVIMPFTETSSDAWGMAERIRAAAEDLTSTEGYPFVLTISAGVAVSDGSVASPIGLVELADSALLEAKHRGKNRVLAPMSQRGAPPAHVMRPKPV